MILTLETIRNLIAKFLWDGGKIRRVKDSRNLQGIYRVLGNGEEKEETLKRDRVGKVIGDTGRWLTMADEEEWRREVKELGEIAAISRSAISSRALFHWHCR